MYVIPFIFVQEADVNVLKQNEEHEFTGKSFGESYIWEKEKGYAANRSSG